MIKNRRSLVFALLGGLLALALALPAGAEDRPRVVMLGDSLTEGGGDWAGLAAAADVFNLGRSGDTTGQILDRLDQVIAQEPDLIFLQAGINDFGRRDGFDRILGHHEKIWRALYEARPEAKLYVASLLPVSERRYPGWNRKIAEFNQRLAAAVRARGLVFIDLYPLLYDPDQEGLRPDFTYDGLHLTGPAYRRWAEALTPYLTEGQK